MKRFFLIFLPLIFLLSRCYIDVEVGEPYVNVRHVDEYETSEIVSQVYSGGQLIYKEIINHAWIDIELHNTGNFKACNVSAEIYLYRGSRAIIHDVVYFPNLRSGEAFTVSYDTGFNFLSDYDDYEVIAHWD